MDLFQTLVGTITTLSGAFALIWGARATMRNSNSTKGRSEVQALAEVVETLRGDYEAQAAEVGRLKDRVKHLESERDEERAVRRGLVDHIEDLHRWIRDGAKPPPPSIPATLAKILGRNQ